MYFYVIFLKSYTKIDLSLIILFGKAGGGKVKEPRLYRIVRPILTFFFRLLFRPTYVGRENIPAEGRVVLAGNHTSFLDCLLLISSTKRTIHFLAKDSLAKGWKKPIFLAMGIIPVNRKIHDHGALVKGEEELKEGKVIGIFPEGTINRLKKDVILPFKIGAVKMSYDAKSPLVVFVIEHKYKFLRRSVKITFFKPYLPSSDLTEENEMLMNQVKEKLKKENQK